MHCNAIFITALYCIEIAYSSCLLLLLTACSAQQAASSQKALSRPQFLCSPALGLILGAELLFNSSRTLNSQCSSQREVEEAFAVCLFNLYSTHTSIDFQRFTTPPYAGGFQREQRVFEYFPLFLFLEHGRLTNHAQVSLPNGKILNVGKQSVFPLSLFYKLTEPFLTVVLQRVLSRKPSLSPSRFSLGKLEVLEAGQTLSN